MGNNKLLCVLLVVFVDKTCIKLFIAFTINFQLATLTLKKVPVH